jgi:dihydropteroate synthase
MIWQTSRYTVDLTRPQVMGIVNATPDSFSDGGMYFRSADALGAVLAHCERLVADGADLLDIGGESTRPGATALSLDDELARVLPVLRHAVTLGVPVSVDTYKSEVMQQALDLGCDIINDIWALRQPGAARVVAAHARCGICLMHMHRDPATMQLAPMQGDVVPQVARFLQERSTALLAMGIDARRIVLDPGIGFGKTAAQNFALLARQQELLQSRFALLAGWSRKSSLAAEKGDLPASRVAASVAAALLAVERGARIVRVHDVRDTVLALRVWSQMRAAGSSAAA